MGIAGTICLLMGFVYFFFTQDTPQGNFSELRKEGKLPAKNSESCFMEALKDPRSWVLFLVYAGCFGIELTVYNFMDDYLVTQFEFTRGKAGVFVACFALMNIFARTLGGICGDKFGIKEGLKGRVKFLMLILIIEGALLAIFSQITVFAVAFFVLILFSLSVQMAEGATFTVVPFINKKAVGSVSGIVGAGGNAGAVLTAMLIRSNTPEGAVAAEEAAAISQSFLMLGLIIICFGLATKLITFSQEDEQEAAEATAKAQKEKD